MGTVIFIALVLSTPMGLTAVLDISARSGAEWPATGLPRLAWAAIAWLLPLGWVAYFLLGRPERLARAKVTLMWNDRR